MLGISFSTTLKLNFRNNRVFIFHCQFQEKSSFKTVFLVAIEHLQWSIYIYRLQITDYRSADWSNTPMFIYPIITPRPLDRLASNFERGNRENHGNVLILVLSKLSGSIWLAKFSFLIKLTKRGWTVGESMSNLGNAGFPS